MTKERREDWQQHLNTFGQRLETQRKKLNMTQTELATLCATSQRVQSGYERGLVAPKLDYLFKLDKLGFDVQSLLFAGEHQGVYILDSREQTVIDLYRQASIEVQLRVLELLAAQAVRQPDSHHTVNSNVAVLAGKQSIKTIGKQKQKKKPHP